MATAVWLHGSNNMRLTEGLVSALKEERSEYLPALLANYREHGGISTQSSGAAGGLIGLSNARLSSSKTRFEGLCLLSILVKDSSSEVFQQHCLSWLRSLQQVIQSQAPLPSVQLAVSVLQDLLQYSSQLPELAREVGLNSILGILTSLLGLKSECHLAAMEGMTACMTFYPRACGSLRDKLGAYFLSKMDSDNPKVQQVACQCYGCLPCLGGVLERAGGGRRAEGWASQLHCLLASAHSILDQLYQSAECVERTMQYEGPGVELPFSPLDETDPLLVLQLRHRYRAVCLALKYTLSVDPVSPVRLPVQNVLNLVCRALAVSCKSINVSGDGSLKLLVLPSVHTDSLELLSALITAVRSGLVQYCSVLTRLFSQTLSAWSPMPEASLGQQRAYSAVRVLLYRTMELWVRVGGASSGVLQGNSTHTELLMAHLLGDITPGADSVKLRVGQGAVSELMGHAGKAGPRRAKGLGIGDGSAISLQRKGDVLANQDTCLSALRALRQIILTSGTLLKEDIHKRLQDLVLPLCVRLQQQLQCGAEVGGGSGQYGNAPPRRELYRLLLAMVLAPPPRWPPPLTCAVSIFSHGRKDRSLMVSSFCTEALTVCNSLLHPRTASLALPLPPLSLKHTPAAPSLTPSQNPSLSLPALLGGPTQGAPFPARHPLSLGPAGLLGPLENHLPLPPSVLPPQAGPAPTPGDLLLSPPQPGELAALGAPEGHRPVFVRYDKEEAEDVEISLESDSDDSVVIVPQGMLMLESQDSAGTQPIPPPPPGGAVPTVGVGTGGDTGVVNSPLPNDLPTSLPHQILPSNSNAINTFTGQSQAQLVSLVPQLNSTAAQLTAPPVGLGDSLPGAQLQQMLMQTSPAGQPSQLGLPIQMQLQTQLAQTSRQLQQQQQQQQQMASEEDLTVININSSDEEEDEDEDMEDEDDLGEEEEEEEEGLDDEEEEEEEGSDFAEEDEYYGEEEFEDYEDEEEGMIEAEEMEEEAEGLPMLEGESRRAMLGREEGEVMMGSAEDRGLGMYPVEREREEDTEVQAGSSEPEGGHGVYRQPVDSTEGNREEGAKEEVEGEVGVTEEGKDSSRDGEQDDGAIQESRGDSQPQAPAGEIIEDPSELEKDSGVELGGQQVTSQEQGPSLDGEDTIAGEIAISCQEGDAESSKGVRITEEEKGTDLEPEQPRLVQQEKAKQETDISEEVKLAGPSVESREVVENKDEDDDEEDLRGTKRKREEQEEEMMEQNVEKKKMDEEAMASMLADFVDCPPDEEDNAHSPTHS